MSAVVAEINAHTFATAKLYLRWGPAFDQVTGRYPWAVAPIFSYNDTAATEIYTLSLHDALPICPFSVAIRLDRFHSHKPVCAAHPPETERSEEHTSELQSQSNLVCRLLLEK